VDACGGESKFAALAFHAPGRFFCHLVLLLN
jgi:hypothetical protein